MREIINKFKPPILIEISPFFLKGFNIKTEDLLGLLRNDMDYAVFHLEEGKTKLKPLQGKPIESNYILIHKTKTDNYKKILEL